MDIPENQWNPRPATEDDLPEMVAIENQLHLAPWTLEHFREEMAKPYAQVWVMTDDETDSLVAAYIAFRVLFEECEILNIAVARPYRSLGLAKRLIRSAVTFAVKQGVRQVVLDVRKSNLPAIQLYHGLGFEIHQIRKEFYSDGEDAYSMKLDQDDWVQGSGVF